MPRQKATVFLGSSREAQAEARALAKALSGDANISAWWSDDSFRPARSTLDGLLLAARRYDFGIFIFSPDDKTTSRGDTFFSARDNALFEFGLFLGALGQDRAWATAAVRGDNRVRPPSDLLGITIPSFSYEDENDLPYAINRIAIDFGDRLKKLGPRNFNLVGSWDFTAAGLEFVIELDPARMMRHADRLGERELVLVYRKDNPDVFRDDDPKIVIGTPRKVSPDEQRVVLRARPAPELANALDIKAGDRVNGYLFILPRRHDLNTCTTIGNLLDAGCVLLDREFGITVK